MKRMSCRALYIVLLMGLFNPIASAVSCDVDADSDIDRNDINAIFAARNTPANGPNDPRDADGDGIITVNDGRQCVLQCTLPRCAIIDPDPNDVDNDNDGFTENSRFGVGIQLGIKTVIPLGPI